MIKGYVQASSQNLPKVDLVMLVDFISNNECFQKSEMQNVKTRRSMRLNYGDAAIGYVQILRKGQKCFIQAKVCPEHEVNAPDYTVQVVIDEEEELVEKAECQDCAAPEGGCKHAVAVLAWLHRRSEEPARTSVECYWRKPALSGVGSSVKFKTLKCMLNKQELVQNFKNTNTDREFFSLVLEKGKKNTSNNNLISFFNPNTVQKLSMHCMSVTYKGDRNNVSEFLEHCTKAMTPENCEYALQVTCGQSSNMSWHELRFGRISASIIYEASKCETYDGSLVEKIMSMSTVDTLAMERGRKLESQVLTLVEQELISDYGESALKKFGIRLRGDYPVLGASPDAETNAAVVEVKCPTKNRTVKTHLDGQRIQDKYRAQSHLQMFLADKQVGYFCVADPQFEDNGEYTIIKENRHEKFIEAVIERAMVFWMNAIYPKLMYE